MEGLISSGNQRSYEDFKKQLSPKLIPLVDLLREFCFSLGKNVIEDVRMHRIVFCKSIRFRWFADMEPQLDSILIKIQSDRRKPQQTMQIKPEENLDEIKKVLNEAYSAIL